MLSIMHIIVVSNNTSGVTHMAEAPPDSPRARTRTPPSRYRLTPGDLVRTPAGVGVITDFRDNTVYDPALAQVLIDGRQRWYPYRDVSRTLEVPE